MTKIIENDKVIMCDIDDTLLMHDLSDFHGKLPEDHLVTVDDLTSYKNQKNINLVIKLSKLGYTIIGWSQSGAHHAERVCKAVGIDKYMSLYMSKPRYHIDDLPADAWMGTRLWRDPVTGKESFDE